MHVVRKIRYSRMTTNERTCKQNMKILRLLGFSINMGEALSEYKVRLKHKFSRESLAFIDGYEKLLYSEYLGDEDDISLSRKSNRLLWVILKKNKTRYLMYLW